MPEHNLSGLMELLVVLGLLFWFWQSQVSPLRKGRHRGDHLEPPQANDKEQGHQPRASA